MRITRTLPPVGYRLGLDRVARGMFAAALGRDSSSAFEREIERHFGVRRAFTVSSGKAALAIILRALHGLSGRRTVIVPAYTCYSVPSAIVRAGLTVAPCDIAPGTFDYDYERLQSMLGPDVLCVLSIHLFGIPSDTARVTALCRPKDIFVVEDAAQAMGVEWGSRKLGSSGDAGFFSLGRGKNVTCGTGGIIVTQCETVNAAITKAVSTLGGNGVLADAQAAMSMAVMSFFISPALYWLPAGLPFLRLGETIFDERFQIRRLSATRSAVLRDWLDVLVSLNATRLRNASYYIAHIADARNHDASIPYLRFPLRIERTRRERLLSTDAAQRLGISRMYRASVAGIAELDATLNRRDYPEAERVAASLVTLPTHPLLTDRDLARICELVDGRPEIAARQSAA